MVSDDRGQLILVGAVAIALVLLGLVLIVNTALFTQVVGSEGTVEATEDGGVASQELGDALAAVVAAENREHDDVAGHDAFDAGANATVESAMVNRTLEHSGAIVSVEYLRPAHNGTRIAQTDPGNFTDAAGSSGAWMPINEDERGELGRFVVSLDPSTDGELSINASGSDELNLDVDSDSVNVSLNGNLVCTAEASNGPVRIDVYNGNVAENGDCQFDLIDSPSAPQWIEFGEEVETVQGTYEIVGNTSVDGSRFAPSTSSEPTATEAVWSFDYRYSYRTNPATVESTSRRVEVYD